MKSRITSILKMQIVKNVIRVFGLPIISLIIYYFVKKETIEYLPGTPYLLLTLLIILHSWVGGLISGIFVASIGAVISHYYFIEPFNSFKSWDDKILLQFVIFYVQAIIIALIISRVSKTTSDLSIAHDEIKSSHRRLHNILDGINAYIALLSIDGTIVEQNKLLENLKLSSSISNDSGYIYDSLPWKKSLETSQKLRNAIEDAKNGLETYFDGKIQTAEDKFIDVSIYIAPIYNNGGKLSNILLTAIDITDRKNYELYLQRATENYYKLIDSNIVGMIIVDSIGNIIEANQAFLNLIGYADSEFKGSSLNLKSLIRLEDHNPEVEDLDMLLTQGSTLAAQKEIIDKNGNAIPIIITSVLINEQEKRYLSLIIDITEHKKLDKKKDEFISIASHELKTPLTTMRGYVQLLHQNFLQIYKERLDYIDIMQNQISKLNELVDDLLDVSKIETGKLSLDITEFNIVELINEVIKETAPFSREHKINLIANPTSIKVKADRFRISQVLANFLTNAMKFSPPRTNINIYAVIEKDYVIVKVQDFGVGVKKSELKNIFKKFYQGENNRVPANRKSMGLGLYISSDIIKLHNGSIGVESEEGQGSTFYFALPL